MKVRVRAGLGLGDPCAGNTLALVGARLALVDLVDKSDAARSKHHSQMRPARTYNCNTQTQHTTVTLKHSDAPTELPYPHTHLLLT